MTWLYCSIAGSISLVILNTLSKKLGMIWSNLGILMPISCITTLLFWQAWQTSPNTFLQVWFWQSAMVTGGAFLTNALFIKDTIRIFDLMGIALIILGTGFLRWR